MRSEDVCEAVSNDDGLYDLTRLRGELTAARRREATAKSTMDGLALAIFTVRPDGRCTDLNATASAVISRGDGVELQRDRLVPLAQGAAEPLRSAIQSATARQNPQASSLMIPRSTSLRPYLATVSPLRTGAGPSLAIIVLRDPQPAGGAAGERLRQLFGLSPTEASLAVALAQGLTPDDMASTRHVSLNTIRTQLRAVSEKMGCNRLAQVAALVASLPPT